MKTQLTELDMQKIYVHSFEYHVDTIAQMFLTDQCNVGHFIRIKRELEIQIKEYIKEYWEV